MSYMNTTLEKPGLGGKLLSRCFLGVLLAIIVGVSIGIAVPSSTVTQIQLEESGYIEGSTGATIVRSSTTGTTKQILLNSSPFPGAIKWNMWAYPITDSESSYFQVTEEATGGYIELSRADVHFDYLFHMNILDHTEGVIIVNITGISGSIDATLYVEFRGLMTDDSSSLQRRTEISLDAGDSGTLLIEIPMNEIRTRLSSLWAAQVDIVLEFHTASESVLVINDVIVEVQSVVPLYPLTVDLQDTMGSSLNLAAKSWYWIEVPGVNLTRDSSSRSWALILPRNVNETIYVQNGNYTAIAGIFSYDYSNVSSITEFEFEDGQNIHISIRLYMIQISLDISPDIYYTGLRFNWDEYWNIWFDFEDLSPPYPDHIYIPARSGQLSASISYNMRQEGRYSSASDSLDIDGNYNLLLTVRLPLFSFFGAALTAGEIVIIIIGIALLIGIGLSLQKPRTPYGWRIIKSDPRFAPLFLLGLSVIFPWFNFSQVIPESSLIPIVFSRDFYLPLCVMMDSTQTSLGSLFFSRYFILDVPFKLLIFWAPLAYVYSKIGQPQKWKNDTSFFAALLLPVLLAFLTYSTSFVQLVPNLGLLLVIAAPFVWGFELLIYHKVIKSGRSR